MFTKHIQAAQNEIKKAAKMDKNMQTAIKRHLEAEKALLKIMKNLPRL